MLLQILRLHSENDLGSGENESACLIAFGQIELRGEFSKSRHGGEGLEALSLYLGVTIVLAESEQPEAVVDRNEGDNNFKTTLAFPGSA